MANGTYLTVIPQLSRRHVRASELQPMRRSGSCDDRVMIHPEMPFSLYRDTPYWSPCLPPYKKVLCCSYISSFLSFKPRGCTFSLLLVNLPPAKFTRTL